MKKNQIVGTFIKNSNFGFVVPDNKEIKTDIFIQKSNFRKAKNKQKVVVEITKPEMRNKKPEGKIIEIIKGENQAEIDMKCLIKEFGLPEEFPKLLFRELDLINEKIDKKDIPNRVDLRDRTGIVTIDGEDAKDLDDAVEVEKLDNGNYMLSVHIADVSYYVKEGSNLDKEASYRGTSVYMLNKVIPMLPTKLSNGICSLNAGEDRFTISITMEIDKEGKVISADVYKAIIKVAERMSYKDVSRILEGKNKKILKRYESNIDNFKLMAELSQILKQRREEAGSLELDIPESKITLDENGVAVNVEKYEITPANDIIEQFMLIANEQIAEKFFWLEAPFIYRVHETPDMEKITELNRFLHNLGYKVKCSKDAIYPKAFSQVIESAKGKPEEKIVSNLILRTLKQARYENENKGHFGLASKYYCHFTSPIRRYPDLFIHRIISKYLANNYNVNDNVKEKLSKIAKKQAELSSERERRAVLAEREADNMKKAEYMESKIGKEYEGIISGVTSFGVFVELENTVEGLIRFDNLGKDYYIYDEERKTIVGQNSKETFSLGDKIRIKVIEASKELRKIGFARVK